MPGLDGGTSGRCHLCNMDAATPKSHTTVSAMAPRIAGRASRDVTSASKVAEAETFTSITTRSASIFRSSFRLKETKAWRLITTFFTESSRSQSMAAARFLKEGQRSFHIHHNYFTTSYAIEFPRNNVEIDHNLFDFDVKQDGGNLISGFGGVAALGPAWFHNNLVNNPGRGVIWNERAFTKLEIRNNHIVTRTTATPRTSGLFGIGGTDFTQTKIFDNIIECRGQARPLLRSEPSYGAQVSNNRLTNVSDTDHYKNAMTDAKPGLEQPLKFQCGVHDELSVDGWQTRPSIN